MKRTLQTLLFALIAMMMPIGLSAHDFEVGGIYYNIISAEDNTVAVTFSGDSYDAVDDEYTGEVAIPATVTHGGVTYRVTSIGSSAFRYCTSLTSITIPSSVTSIGSSAFMRCSGLTSITLPEGVTSIEDDAFWYCTGLASITIPSSVTSIGGYAFSDCTGLASITLPEGVTSIGNRVFSRCTSLASITIPKSVTSIGRNAFYNCLFLGSNFINNSKCSDATNWGAIFYTEEEEVDGMIIRNKVLVAARGNLTIANIPEGVTSIEGYAFYYCTSLTSVTIPEGVTSIGLWAFRCCTGLTSITLPESVTSIGGSAFSGCSGLTSITIPEGVTSIGNSAFEDCTSLADVCYLGSAEQWEAIEIGSSNNSLTNATRHYYDANGFCTAHEGDYQPAPLNAEGYYEIANGGQLFWFAQQVNEGGEEGRYLKAVLKNDIDLEGRSWTPIGTTGGTTSQSFRGVFDGNGKTITGLNVDNSKSGLGFFGEVRKGVVKDFTIYGEVKLNGKYNYVGGVIGSACGIEGDNGSIISGITSYVNVTLGEGSHGSNHVAGLIGYVNHNTTVDRCTWLGTLDLGIYRAQDGVGGLIGKANAQCVGTISNCAAYGTIRTAYKSGSYVNPSDSQPLTNIFIGGIVSNSLAGATTNIENCIWAGNIVDETGLGENAHIAAIGTLNGVGSVANCYYLEGSAPYVTTHNAYDTNGKVFGVSLAQLMNGEIAAKLGEAWGQNIDGEGEKDAKPVVGGAKLHYGYLTCDENAPMAYTNNAEVSEVKPEHSYVDGFCTVCGDIDAEGGIVIRDGQYTAFAIAEDMELKSLTYIRTLPNTEWNSLYLPFEVPVTEELLDEYEVAYVNDMHAADTDDNGEIDEIEMEIVKIKTGALHANHPYFIRAKSMAATEVYLSYENTTLHATEETTLNCSSIYMDYAIVGNYKRIKGTEFASMPADRYYAISIDGGWWQIPEDSSLYPFRVYLAMTARDGSPVKVSDEAMTRMRIVVRGDGEETTGVEEMKTENREVKVIYDLQGRKIEKVTTPGIYIVNGKKVVIK